MTIGVDIRVLLDAQYSGVAEYTLKLLQALIKEDKLNHYVLFYNSAKNLDERLPDLSAPNVTVVSRHWPNKLLNYGLFKFFNWPKLDALIGQKLDVCWLPHLNFVAWPKAKNILTVHDLSFLLYPEFFSVRKNFWHRQLSISKLVRGADKLIAISENTKRDIVALTGFEAEKISVVYSGVSADYQPLARDDSGLLAVKQKYNLPDKFILYLGTIEPRKNLVGLIEAYNYLRKQYSALAEVKLVLAGGDGWKDKAIFRSAKDSAFREDIKFLGYVATADKVALYNLAKVFVFPSFYEGFGFPPLEAMASGTPVVASFASSLPEVVGEAGILVDPYNSADIGEATAQILLSADLSQRLLQAGLIRAKKFSWEKTAKQYLEIFKN